jgi:predicted membrane-bound spermidine synthase
MSESLVYFEAGDLVAESGDAKVYKFNDDLFLEIGPGHNLWALESELPDYVWQLNDRPRGNCLEIGLGLGIASKYILSLPRVRALTTVEINKDVIDVHSKLKPEHFSFDTTIYPEKRHTILNVDGLIYMYETKQVFDFIFIDCYKEIDEDALPMIADMTMAAKRILADNGEMMGWFDKATPECFIDIFYSLFKK